MSEPVANPRRLAASLLQKILQDKSTLASPEGSDHPESALIQELCYGVCRHYFSLAELASKFLKKPLKSSDQDIYCLILLGLYQLFYLRIPDHAVINETVGSVKKPWAKGLVNAVLRNARRRYPEEFDAASLDTDEGRYAHPQWLIDELRKDWAPYAEDILHANNARPPMSLRVNLGSISREDYLGKLQAAGIEASPGQLALSCIHLAQPCPVHKLPGFAEGLVSVQDEASQLLPTLLKAEPGMRVLDACAAPGGKTCALLEQAPGIDLLAIDNDVRRLPRIEENLQRLKLKATVLCADATSPADWAENRQFDRILVDAPCSAVGVIRRHPDIKLLRRPEQVGALAEKQQAMLSALWSRLAPQGILLYSTCSTLIAENSAQIADFCRHTPGASHLPIQATWGQMLPYGRQLLPGMGNQDGFYYALLQKC